MAPSNEFTWLMLHNQFWVLFASLSLVMLLVTENPGACLLVFRGYFCFSYYTQMFFVLNTQALQTSSSRMCIFLLSFPTPACFLIQDVENARKARQLALTTPLPALISYCHCQTKERNPVQVGETLRLRGGGWQGQETALMGFEVTQVRDMCYGEWKMHRLAQC